METVTASKLRTHIFEYLGRVKKGESITVILNKREIARLVPVRQEDWREGLQGNFLLNCSSEELMAPMDDVWEEYV